MEARSAALGPGWPSSCRVYGAPRSLFSLWAPGQAFSFRDPGSWGPAPPCCWPAPPGAGLGLCHCPREAAELAPSWGSAPDTPGWFLERVGQGWWRSSWPDSPTGPGVCVPAESPWHWPLWAHFPRGSPARPPGRPGRRQYELEKCLREGRLTPFPTHNTPSRVPHSAPVHTCVGHFTCVLSGQPPTVPRPHPLSMGKQVQRFRRCLRAVHLVSAKLRFEPDLRLQSQGLAAGSTLNLPNFRAALPPGNPGSPLGWPGPMQGRRAELGSAPSPPAQKQQPLPAASLPPWELGDQTGDVPCSAWEGQPEGQGLSQGPPPSRGNDSPSL